MAISDGIVKKLESLTEDENSEEAGEENVQDKEVDLECMFYLGQYLRAYVTSTSDDDHVVEGKGKKKHIELSIDPRQVNIGLKRTDLTVNSTVQATVASIEDHGLVMDIGIEDDTLRGFMSSKEVGGGIGFTNISKGSVFLCVITGSNSSGNIIKLSSDPQKIGSVKKSNYMTEAPTIDSFRPGTAVEVLVDSVSASGIAGKIMGLLDATADLMHSGFITSNEALEKRYPPGSKIKARIICTFPLSDEKKVGLSLLDHIITMQSPKPRASKDGTLTELLPVSTIVSKATIVKVEPHMGLFLDVGLENIRAFVHISRVADEKVQTLSESSGAYRLGSIHRARIVGFNGMDGCFNASMEQKIIDLPFLRLEDVKVGEPIHGTIERLVINATGVAGLIVKLADGISGLVPEMHLADVRLQHPERRFKQGQSVTARVLSTDLEKRQIRLTLKKTLVNSGDGIWKSYDNLTPGMRAPGTLVNILPSGAVVQFYGSVRGFLPVSEMSESYIQDPKKHFHAGQVVTVHITSVDPAERRMRVSCRDIGTYGISQQKALADLVPGTIVNATVSEKTSDSLIVELPGISLKAILPVEHLADGSTQRCVSLAKKIRVGQLLQDILVLSKNERKRLVRITCKPSLVKASMAGKLLSSFEDVTEGAEVSGFVRNITPTAVFVEFAGDLTALLSKNCIPEDVVRLPDFSMRRDQSITTKVLTIDFEQRRFLLTQKPIPDPRKGASAENTTTLISDRILSNPTDGISKSMDDFSLGKLTKARIFSVKQTQINVQLADSVQGRIDISAVFDSWDEIKDKTHPLKKFRIKQVLPVRILGVHDSRNHRYLPISHIGKAPVFELSAMPKDQTEADLDVPTLGKVEVGSTWNVFVNNVNEDCLWVTLSPNVRGRIRAMDASDDVSLLSDLEKNFPIGSALHARVLSVDVANNRLDLSARSSGGCNPQTLEDLTEGMVLPVRVTKVTERQIIVQLSEHLSGPIHLMDLADDFSLANTSNYEKNQIIRVCVNGIDIPNKKITLSARPSKVLSSSLPVTDPEIYDISQIKVGDVVRGFVTKFIDSGILVSLASSITAYVRVSDLSDSFIKEWQQGFQLDQLVKGKITAVDPLLNHIQMSLKASIVSADYKPPLTYADIEVGQILTGKIRKVEEYGVFIVVDRSANVSGLCHRSEMAEKRVSDARKLYEEGDEVKAKVLKLESDKRRISFGLKASYFEDDDKGEDNDEIDNTDNLEGAGMLSDGSVSEDFDIEKDDANDIRSVDDSNGESDDNSEVGNAKNGDGVRIPTKKPKAPPLTTTLSGLNAGGFNWAGAYLDENANAAPFEEDELEEPKKKKRKAAQIKVDRTGDLDANGPQSVADFERLLLGQPDSSYLWLSYMAFQLQLNEIAKARDIAERAIRTISAREETEKLNVWIALLNLENTYGNDESVEEVFKRSCQYNDAQEIHERLTSIFIQSGKTEVS